VGKGLREVAELASSDRVVLLGQQTNIVTKVEQPLEQLARLVVTALQLEHRYEPERARDEGALAARETVDTAFIGR
jgi:hypothetical protein